MLRTRKSPIQREFERTMLKIAPDWLDRDMPRAMRNAAMNRVLGTPDAVISTPQERLLCTIPYTNGNTSRIYSPDIPRSCFPYWILRLNGTLTKTEAVAGTLVPEGPLTLVTGMRVLIDGEVMKEIDLAHLRVISHHIYRGSDTNLVNVTLGNDAAEPFSSRIALDFRTLRSEKPDATFFPSDRYGQLAVEIDWAASTTTGVPALINGGTYSAVSFPTPPQLQIYGKEVLEPGKRNAPYWLQKYTQKVFSVSSNSQTAAPYQLPTGEVVRGILISQYTGNPRLPITTLIPPTANIVLRANGSYRKWETTWQELTEKNQADYGIALPAGYAFLDFMDPDNGGLYENAFRTDQGVNMFEALVDTASVAGAFLQFTLVTFKPARNYN